MRRALTVLLLLALMGGFAFGVNRFLASRRTVLPETVAAPTKTTPAFSLPGLIIVAQDGQLYRLDKGVFTSLNLPTGLGQWMQPSIVPGTDELVAVVRAAAYSEVYLIADTGSIIKQLSHNQTTSTTIQYNHWMFWPRVAADGHTFYVSYDAPKTIQSYEIDFAVWKGDIDGTLTATEFTFPNGYTGGDVQPVPLSGGALLYTKYADVNDNIVGQIALQRSPSAVPVLLTSTTADCGQPAVSPSGTEVAMVCIGGTSGQSSRLEVASLTGTTLGTPRVLVSNCLCAAPSWSPDGTGLLYFNPVDATGHFQMWWIAGASTAAPKPPRQMTATDDFDATSPAAWAAG